MKFQLRKPKPNQGGFAHCMRLGFASLAVVLTSSDFTSAASAVKEQVVDSRPLGEPVMAIISPRDQQITIYDTKGWTMRAPVSSGQLGCETPAGIFSVIQKEAEHYSNIYDDGGNLAKSPYLAALPLLTSTL